MRKVLIITYYWPPAGGPGVQRVLRFVRHLPEFGWEPVILTVENGDYPAIDNSLVDQVHAKTPVFRTQVAEPYDLYRRLTGKASGEKLPTYVMNRASDDRVADRLAKWVRANIFIPDARIGWLPKGRAEAVRLIRELDIDLIFTSSPPHTAQLIGKSAAKRSRRPWVADLRDPWTEAFWAAEFKKLFVARQIDERLEKGVLQRADAVTTVTPGLVEMLRDKVNSRYEVIQNGFEPIEAVEQRSDSFIALFTGHLSKYQNPEPFFRAALLLPEDVKNDLRIIFVGKQFSGFDEVFQRYADQINIQRLDYMAHSDMIDYAQGAAVLLRPIADHDYSSKAIGAKTYDYLALRKPILTLGKTPSISADILEETASGEIFNYTDVEGIAGFLKKWHQSWKKNGYLILDNVSRLNNYTTRSQVEKLANLFYQLSAGSVKR